MKKSSRLLIDESPLVVQPTLAKLLGTNEALLLQQIHYWISNPLNENHHKDRIWVYKTYEGWAREITFISLRTIKRTLKKLKQLKIIMVDRFNRKAQDRTNWYTIDYDLLECLEKGTLCQTGTIEDNGENSGFAEVIGDSPIVPNWHNAKCQLGTMHCAKLALCTSNKITTETTTNINAHPAHPFDTFWDSYPKKVDKKKAKTLFDKLLKKKPHLFEKIMAGLKAQAEEREARELMTGEKIDKQFLPGPAVWLRNHRWEDETEKEQTNARRPNNQQSRSTPLHEKADGRSRWLRDRALARRAGEARVINKDFIEGQCVGVSIQKNEFQFRPVLDAGGAPGRV